MGHRAYLYFHTFCLQCLVIISEIVYCCFEQNQSFNSREIMGRGVSSGGGQSSLGYLFGDGEPPKPTTNKVEAPQNQGPTTSDPQKPTATAPAPNVNKQIPAGIQGRNSNNYFRADGQNTGNFLTVRCKSSFFQVGFTMSLQITCPLLLIGSFFMILMA